MRTRSKLFSVIVVLSAAMICVFAWLLLRDPPTAFAPRPDPNGYEALVAAAAKLPRLPDIGDSSSTDEVGAFMKKNQATLAELRRALDLPSAVTVEMSENWTVRHSREMMDLKAAALFLDAQAELFQREGSNSTALTIALDGLRLAAMVQNEGTFIDYLVGSACELIAVNRLTNLLVTADLDSCKRAARQLELLDQQRDPFPKLAERESEWSWRAFNIGKRLNMMVQTRSLRPGKEWEKVVPDTATEYRMRTTVTRLAILRFASRSYELEAGEPPSQTTDLVPKYLSHPLTNLMTGAVLELPGLLK